MSIKEFKCPNCGGSVSFSPIEGKVKCEFCDSEFDAASIEEYAQILESKTEENMSWDDSRSSRETDDMNVFTCPACGGEIIADSVTVASRCPYCDTPAVMTSRVSGVYRPDYIVPFSVTKQQAKDAFYSFCKKKPFLPKFFTKEATIDNITGIYAPFWLFDCNSEINADFKTTRVTHWSDSKYIYTKTDHFYVHRRGNMSFSGVPVDGSSKIDNACTESIEPFDCNKAVPFNASYLTGFAADRYDEDASVSQKRANERIRRSCIDAAAETVVGYSTVIPTDTSLSLSDTKESYALLPMWLLNMKYKDKIYTFAMNGQTGKFVGNLPISIGKALGCFFGLTAGLTAILYLLSMFFM